MVAARSLEDGKEGGAMRRGRHGSARAPTRAQSRDRSTGSRSHRMAKAVRHLGMWGRHLPRRDRGGESIALVVRRGAAWAALALVAIVASSATAGWYVVGPVRDRVDRADDVARLSAAVDVGVLDQEAGLRGYLLTRDNTFLQPYERGVISTTAALGDLATLVRPDPVLVERVKVVRDRVGQWQGQFAEPALSGARAISSPINPAALDAGKSVLDGYRSAQQRLVDSASEARSGALRDQRRVVVLVVGAQAALGVLAVLRMAACVHRVRADTTAAVRSLIVAVEGMARGDRSLLPEVRGPGELRQLAGSLASMAAALRRSDATARAQHERDRSRSERSYVLLEATRRIDVAPDAAAMASAIAATLVELARAERVAVWLAWGRGGDRWAQVAVAGTSDQEPPKDPRDCDECMAALSSMRLSGDERDDAGRRVAHGHVAVPLVSGQAVLGLAEVVVRSDCWLDADDLAALEEFLGHATQLLAGARRYEQLRLMLTSSADGVIGMDREGHGVYFNPAALKILGMTMASVSGRPVHDLLHRHRSEAEAQSCALREAIETQAARRRVDDVVQDDEGGARAIDWSLQPLHVQRQMVGYVMTVVEPSHHRPGLSSTSVVHDSSSVERPVIDLGDPEAVGIEALPPHVRALLQRVVSAVAEGRAPDAVAAAQGVLQVRSTSTALRSVVGALVAALESGDGAGAAEAMERVERTLAAAGQPLQRRDEGGAG